MDERKPFKKEYITLPSGKKVNKKSWIMSSLRRMSYRWPPRNEILKNSRIERGLYKCAMCENGFSPKEVAIDHIEPVIPLKNGFPIHPITGNPDWTIVIERLFCDLDGFQILCTQCHDIKTSYEDSLRADYNKKQKELIKKEKKKNAKN